MNFNKKCILKFLVHVIEWLAREFEKEVTFKDLGCENYIVGIGGYEVNLSILIDEGKAFID